MRAERLELTRTAGRERGCEIRALAPPPERRARGGRRDRRRRARARRRGAARTGPGSFDGAEPRRAARSRAAGCAGRARRRRPRRPRGSRSRTSGGSPRRSCATRSASTCRRASGSSFASCRCRRAGIYAPGGRAAYPSTVVMCACRRAWPASSELRRGRRRAATSSSPPARSAASTRSTSWAAPRRSPRSRYGTETIEPVDVIVGPGNAYVQEAKRQVVGAVGHRRHRGALGARRGRRRGRPTQRSWRSTSRPRASTATRPCSCSLTPSERPARARRAGGGAALAPSGRASPTRRSRWCRRRTSTAAVELADAIAPEHLELAVADAERARAAACARAGCVFLGRNGGAAFGDYVAGSNHVLPTGGAARFAGPLGASTFRRRQALVSLPDGAARAACAARRQRRARGGLPRSRRIGRGQTATPDAG